MRRFYPQAQRAAEQSCPSSSIRRSSVRFGRSKTPFRRLSALNPSSFSHRHSSSQKHDSGGGGFPMKASVQTSPEVLPGSPWPSFHSHSPSFSFSRTPSQNSGGHDQRRQRRRRGTIRWRARSSMAERGVVERPLDDALSPLANVGVPTTSGGSLIYPTWRPCAGGGDRKGDPR